MEKDRKLIWDQQALTRLEKSLEWISETSIQQAEQVEQAILERIESPGFIPNDTHQISTKEITQAITVLLKRIVTGFHITIQKMRSGY